MSRRNIVSQASGLFKKKILFRFELPHRQSKTRPPPVQLYSDGTIVVTVDSRNARHFFGQKEASQLHCDEEFQATPAPKKRKHDTEDQPQKMGAKKPKLNSKLAPSNSKPAPSKLSVGSYCDAQYSHDHKWYPAKVVEIQNGWYKVFYVDYNESEWLKSKYVSPVKSYR